MNLTRHSGDSTGRKRKSSSPTRGEPPSKLQNTQKGPDRHSNPVKSGNVPPYHTSNLNDNVAIPSLPEIKNKDLSNQVFTHASVIDSKYSKHVQSTYEQLEFYGDAAIEFISTRLIYHNFPTLLTGRQSILRQSLVNNKTLAGFSRRYGLPEKLNGLRALRHGPQWEKICADIFEAYVAGVVLSSPNGFSIAEQWLTSLWTPLLPKEQSQQRGIDTNYKDELQRKIGGYHVVVKYEKINDPKLEAAASKGGQETKYGVYLTGWGYEKKELGRAIGIGKTEAGMLAAKNALEGQDGLLEGIIETKRIHDEKRKAEKEAAAAAAAAAAAEGGTEPQER